MNQIEKEYLTDVMRAIAAEIAEDGIFPARFTQGKALVGLPASVRHLAEPIFATPAIVESVIYLRTPEHVYAFGK